MGWYIYLFLWPKSMKISTFRLFIEIIYVLISNSHNSCFYLFCDLNYKINKQFSNKIINYQKNMKIIVKFSKKWIKCKKCQNISDLWKQKLLMTKYRIFLFIFTKSDIKWSDILIMHELIKSCHKYPLKIILWIY